MAESDSRPADDDVLQVAMLLERASHRSQGDEFYQTLLKAEALEEKLSKHDVEEIIDQLGSLVLSEKMTSPMLWALGVSSSPRAIVPLVDLFENRGNLLSEEECFQGVTALGDLLGEVSKLDEADDPAIAEHIRSVPFEARIESLAKTGSSRNREAAKRLLGLLRSLKQA